MTRFECEVNGKSLVIRDFEPQDIQAYVAYWTQNDPEYFRSIGIDPAKIKPREVILRTISAEHFVDPSAADHWRYSVTCNDRLIGGFAVVGIRYGESAGCHVHTYDPADRQQGYGKLLLLPALKVIFEMFKLQKLILQPNANNFGPNRLLEAMGLKSEETIEIPEGPLTLPRLARVYVVTRELLERG